MYEHEDVLLKSFEEVKYILQKTSWLSQNQALHTRIKYDLVREDAKCEMSKKDSVVCIRRRTLYAKAVRVL